MGEAELYKLTYHDLILLVQELQIRRHNDETVYDRNIWQARRIMELEFDLRRFRRIMVEDQQENVMKEYGTVASDVVSLEEARNNKAKLKLITGGGGSGDNDWLSSMVWGTEFRVRPKKGEKSWILVTFMMGGSKDQGKTILVIPYQGDEAVQDTKDWLWAEPKAFCEYFELVSIISVPEKENEGWE